MDEEGNAITMRLSFEEDGAFELNQVLELGEDFQSVVEATEIPVEEVTIQGIGTYEVDGDKLSVDITEVEIRVGDRDFFEVLAEVARALARFAADFAGVSEEDYPAFEQELCRRVPRRDGRGPVPRRILRAGRDLRHRG